jgi:DNA-binding beta-propeller fold protein YncE
VTGAARATNGIGSRTATRLARRPRVALALLPALAAGACSSAHSGSATAASKTVLPARILRAPKGLMAAAGPEASGALWALAGSPNTGLFRYGGASSQPLAHSMPVSNAARSVAVSSAGVLGLALATRHSGALELLGASTGRVIQTVPLPAPARQVVASPDSPAFFVLASWASSASVSVVGAKNGVIRNTVPVPADAVSVAPDPAQNSVYVLEKTGLVEEIGLTSAKISDQFSVGSDGRAIAISPDGTTLFVLKGTLKVSNIAVVDAATESVHKVLPAPSYCRGLLVAPTGKQLYEVVGTSGYGNIQVFAL